MVASCSFFFCCFVFSFLFFFVLLKFGSSVLRNQRHFGKAEDRKVVGCVMCSPCLFESKLHLFFSLYRGFSSSQPDVSTRVCKFLFLAFSVFRRFLVLVYGSSFYFRLLYFIKKPCLSSMFMSLTRHTYM